MERESEYRAADRGGMSGCICKAPSTFTQYKTLLAKDLKAEFRTKDMIVSMGIYAFLVIVVFGVALSFARPGSEFLEVSGGLLWALVVFTSLLGLNRSFSKETENGIGTMLSTITAATRGKDVMLALLFVPVIFPLLYACVSATTCALVGGDVFADGFFTSLALGAGYDVIMILASWVLYDFVVN